MKILSLIFGAAMACGGAASAATVANGGFELPGTFSGSFTTINAGSPALAGWSIDAGSVDLINTYWQPSAGGYSIDLSGNAAATISQTIAGLVAGKRYVLSFDMAGNTDSGPIVKTLLASVDGTSDLFSFDTTGRSHGDMGWAGRQLAFVATGASALISFQSLSTGFYGPALDNVSVETAAVPLPAAAPLLGAGLGALAMLRRRRRRA